MIDASKYTAHQRPGKFEGESAATEYYYDLVMNGDGETIYPASIGDDDSGMNDEPCADLFCVDAEESEAFDLPIGHWFMVWTDSQGFAYGREFETREAAERHFAQWCGC